MTVSREAAQSAVAERIATPLGIEPLEAADAIVRVANANMCDALRLISIRRGYDPRDFALVVFGGAGALHGAHLAREMQIPVVIVPRYPGITSALGCLMVDIRHDLYRSYLTPADQTHPTSLESQFTEMEQEAAERLAHEDTQPEAIQLMRFVDMRYVGQWRTLSVPCGRPLAGMEDLLGAFHREHEREYAYFNPDQPVEIHGLRLAAVGSIPKPQLPEQEPEPYTPAAAEHRPVYFAEAGGFVPTPIYDREALRAGSRFNGPAVAEQMDSTTVVPPGFVAEVDRHLNIILRQQ